MFCIYHTGLSVLYLSHRTQCSVSITQDSVFCIYHTGLSVLYLSHRTGKVELDGEISVAGVQWDISTGQETYIGFGPDTHMKCTYHR